ncbi:MAG: helix-turn-helix domain-containing protein [Bacteroidales bacterium]|nr:helix-turn-helix domain-containing protein [Bacteroidales bacterium]
MNYKEIGIQIKERRKFLNITQPTLAALAGVGLNTLVAIERGNGNPKIETLLALLDTLGLKFDITLKD